MFSLEEMFKDLLKIANNDDFSPELKGEQLVMHIQNHFSSAVESDAVKYEDVVKMVGGMHGQ